MSNYFKDWKAQRAEEQKIDLGTYFKFDAPVNPQNPHYFLAEELLVPKLNSADKMCVSLLGD